MNQYQEEERLKELERYNIYDSSTITELDELVELASVICDAPISLITLLDETRQLIKANKGLSLKETTREDSFCQYALYENKELFEVQDSLKDDRFKNNPLVEGSQQVRYYAGAPLVTANGHVLGTLCILDEKPRSLTDSQKKALMLLAKKAMRILETRKHIATQESIIEFNTARFIKLTDQAPGAIFQLERTPSGKLSFPFISKGISVIHPTLAPEVLKENAEIAFDVVHPDDVVSLQKDLEDSYVNQSLWKSEYRVITEGEQNCWHWVIARPEKKEDGTVVWYGTFQDITHRKEYVQTLEQILFDISHVMRKPVASLLGLTSAMMDFQMDSSLQKQYVEYIHEASMQMDSFIHLLNDQYQQTKSKFTTSTTLKEGY